MKKVLSLLTIAGVLSSSAVCAASISCNCAESKGSVSVNTTATREIAPDTAEITIEVVTSDTKSLSTASNKNKQVSDEVYSKLKSMINVSAGDTIKTSNYSANPVYVYSNNKRVLDKYQVSNQVIVKTKSLSSIGSIIDNAMNLGATNINGLNFSSSNYDDQCSDIINEAAQKAYSQASGIAKSAGTSLDSIKNISANCTTSGSSRNYRLFATAKASGADGATESTTIESGTIKIYANVSASYFVK